MRQLPSDKYFNTIETQDQFYGFINTGMAWEVEPCCPSSWEEHIDLKKAWLKHKDYDGS